MDWKWTELKVSRLVRRTAITNTGRLSTSDKNSPLGGQQYLRDKPKTLSHTAERNMNDKDNEESEMTSQKPKEKRLQGKGSSSVKGQCC